MRRMLLSLAILVSWLAAACPSPAGVYNLNPPRSYYPSDYVQAAGRNPSNARVYLGQLRAISDLAPNAKQPPSESLRAGYMRQVEELEAKKRDGTLSPEDRVNLGACLIRMGQIPKATTILEEAQRVVPADAPCRAFLLANLASAYQENEDLLPHAIDLQTQVLKIWPAQWPGWRRGEGLWYRRAETYALKLMQLRQAEQRNTRGRPADYQTVDPLFPRVRFTGPGGRYQAGSIDFAMWNELPFDAESIVLQLLFWRPSDNRLYWQYGELLNARGQVDSAYEVLNELCFTLQQRQPELQEHYRILRAAKNASEDLKSPPLAEWGSWLDGSREQSKAAPPAAPAPNPVLPDWRHIVVSFLAGMVVAVLGILQWQQWRRPRRVAASVGDEVDRDGSSAGEVAAPTRYSRPVDG